VVSGLVVTELVAVISEVEFCCEDEFGDCVVG
jgi:hypothetical protein